MTRIIDTKKDFKDYLKSDVPLKPFVFYILILYIKQEVNDVAVLHNIFLTL